MKRFMTIFSLYAQHALEYKARSLVWFGVILFDVFVYILYWRGVLTSGQTSVPWTFSEAVSYYLLLLVAGNLLQIHIEEEVAFEDIQYGRLSQYLLRPFSYVQFKFFQELPWRLIQGGFGWITLLWISLFVKRIEVVTDIYAVPLVVGIAVSAYMLCFIYKMIIGIIAFWTIDYTGLQNIQTILYILLSGLLIPLHLLPSGIRSFALIQPIAYTLYHPVRAVQGVYTLPQLWQVLGMQWTWAILLYGLYRLLWHKGLKVFTAVGQ